jgi:hypothetical protein
MHFEFQLPGGSGVSKILKPLDSPYLRPPPAAAPAPGGVSKKRKPAVAVKKEKKSPGQSSAPNKRRKVADIKPLELKKPLELTQQLDAAVAALKKCCRGVNFGKQKQEVKKMFEIFAKRPRAVLADLTAANTAATLKSLKRQSETIQKAAKEVRKVLQRTYPKG